MRYTTISYFSILLLLVLSSCDLHLTECEDIQEWKIGKYRIVKASCLGVAGPRYYPVTMYVNGKTEGSGVSQEDSCIFTWQAHSESFLTLNVCNNTIRETRPHKILLDVKNVDSATIFSQVLNQSQQLTRAQVEKFVQDFNNSKTRGYSSDPFDSAFYRYYPYQFKLTLFSNGNRRPFYGYNYLVLDSSNWQYEMSKTAELDYIHKYWNK